MSSSWTVLRAERSYRKLLVSTLVSGMGDWFNSVAVLSLLLQLTGSSLAVGITLGLRTLPYLVMGPIGGILADKWNRKWILIVCDVARGALALCFLFVNSPDKVWVVYAGTVGLILFSASFNPARMAVIPQLVQNKHIATANALEQSMSGVVMAVGSFIGGVATAAWGVHVAFVLNALSFVISALICMTVVFPQDHLVAPPDQSMQSSSLWTLMRSSRVVQIMTCMAVLWPIGGGAINVLLSTYAFQLFHLGNTGVGVMYGALGVGFLMGGILSHRFARWAWQAAVCGWIAEGIAHVCVSQSPNIMIAATFLVLGTIGAGISNAFQDTIVMQSVSKHLHGRVFSLFASTSGIVMSFSMLMTGILVGHLPIRMLGALAGTIIAVCGVLYWIGLRQVASNPVNSGTERSLS